MPTVKSITDHAAALVMCAAVSFLFAWVVITGIRNLWLKIVLDYTRNARIV